MTTIAVIYFSGTGTTRAVAEAVRNGAAKTDSEALLLEVTGADISDGRWANDEIAGQLDACEGIIFGTPTYMGSVAGQYKSFMDAMAPRWYTQAWRGKVAAGFTASSLSAGDKFNALLDLTTFAMQMGMIWVGTGVGMQEGLNLNGFYYGVGATASNADELQEVDINTAQSLGTRVADISARLANDA
ncbi:MAG: flavodoxin family protein [Pseudomonadota bacterium]